jgi:hypothetical protein
MKLAETQRALLYAAMKLAEQAHNSETTECELSPGYDQSLDGLTITIRQGQNTVVIKPVPGTNLVREVGTNGDGTTDKRATQRLFGTAVLAECIQTLSKFNQSDKMLRLFWLVIKRAIRKGNVTQDELENKIGKRAAETLRQTIEEIRQSVPAAPNATPRSIKPPKRGLKPTVEVMSRQKQAG